MQSKYRKRYRLRLRWESIEYLDDTTATLQGACFSGPALKDAVKLEAPDFIDLDLTPQLLVLLDSYYIVRLDWDSVEYAPDNKIVLGDARLTNKVLKEFHKLQKDDYLLINTEKHEEAVHVYNLVYESQVVRKDNEPYHYGEK